MAYAFGSNLCVFEFEAAFRRPDPSKPDPRARAEMAVFDELPPDVRAAFRESRYGASAEALADAARRRGASNDVKSRLKGRGLLPCDVGVEGVMAEQLAIDDEREAARIRAELA